MKVSAKTTGPFFRHDPGQTFRANGRVMIRAATEEGAALVAAEMRSGETGRRPVRLLGDRVADHVIGRVRSLSGRPWEVTGVASVNNEGLSRAEGVSLMAAAAQVEQQTHAFRRVTGRLRRLRSANLDELLKGIS